MPLELSNAPAPFQEVMNEIFRPLVRHFVLVFVDGILMYCADRNSYLTQFCVVLQVDSDHKFFVKLSKYSFDVPLVDYLGHVISSLGLTADPSKLQAMADWLTLCSLSTFPSFLVSWGYYRRYVRHYATI
ncbi:hypothetical protein Sango_3033400 [Sesamum angolense]|uniref:Reverse transcriptase n=1 Tax=Sesamum angolense TaxID=2727404 RepID=A0AAE1VZA9_9LAMI|nr:hypothetical protein Sango_3033400 [Sesamum angolense]